MKFRTKADADCTELVTNIIKNYLLIFNWTFKLSKFKNLEYPKAHTHKNMLDKRIVCVCWCNYFDVVAVHS